MRPEWPKYTVYIVPKGTGCLGYTVCSVHRGTVREWVSSACCRELATLFLRDNDNETLF